jgi:RNA polymerase sigma-70 factor (ECF subfamily)
MLEKRTLTITLLTDKLQDIIKGCIEGDRIAQEQLYNMFAPKMYGVCLRYSQCAEEAQDALQDGFIKVFDKIYQYKNIGSLEGWIRRVMVNTSLESYRKRRNVQLTFQIPDIQEEEAESRDLGLSEKDLIGLIQGLPDKYRMVFNLYVFEEMTHKEIANELKISEGTSKSDLSRARAILQKKINAFAKKEIKFG